MTSSGSTPSASRAASRRRARRSLASHSSSTSSQRACRRPSARRRCSRPSPRRCSITSGTPPARNTRTVGWFRGPFGRASTSRGTARLTRRQSSTVGRAQAGGVGDRGDVDEQVRRAAERRVDEHRVLDRLVREHVVERAPVARHWPCTACAVRRATSSQIGWPDGASAACGTVRPSASATTCEVAAVPRNWQPPPGEAQARQPRSAASSSVTSPWAKRAPRVCTAPASSPRVGGSVTPPGTMAPASSAERGDRHQHRRQALVAGADADDAAPARQRADEPPEDERGVVAVGERVEHPGRALACGRRTGRRRARRTAARPGGRAPAPPPGRAGRPPSGRCGSRARPACRRRPARRPGWTG